MLDFGCWFSDFEVEADESSFGARFRHRFSPFREDFRGSVGSF